jgi:general L-amino acid transport system substrate-binding protein
MVVDLSTRTAGGHTLPQARLHCRVSEGVAKLSASDAARLWTGIDDFCRATAGTASANAHSVVFVPIKASARFLTLCTDVVELLSRNTTWTLV